MNKQQKEDKIYLAKLAQLSQRYNQMRYFMREAALIDNNFTNQQRNLLSIAYRNCICHCKVAWGALSYQQIKSKSTKLNKIASVYKQKIENEIVQTCQQLIDLLNKQFFIKELTNQQKSFYLKLKADHYRYMYEYSNNIIKEQSISNYKKIQQQLQQLFDKCYKPWHPTRLGLSLSKAVYTYEMNNNLAQAYKIGKEAYDKAIIGIQELEQKFYKDSTLILQLLKENLQKWGKQLKDGSTDS